MTTERKWGIEALQQRIDLLKRNYQHIPVQPTLYEQNAVALFTFGGAFDPALVTLAHAIEMRKRLSQLRTSPELKPFLEQYLRETILVRAGRLPKRLANRHPTDERAVGEAALAEAHPSIKSAYLLMSMFGHPKKHLEDQTIVRRVTERSPLRSPIKMMPDLVEAFVRSADVDAVAYFEAVLIFYGQTPPSASQSSLGAFMRGNESPYATQPCHSRVLTTHLLPLVRFIADRPRNALSSVHQRVKQYASFWESVLEMHPHPEGAKPQTLVRSTGMLDMAEGAGQPTITAEANGYLGSAAVIADLQAQETAQPVEDVYTRLEALPTGASVDVAGLKRFLVAAKEVPAVTPYHYDRLVVAMGRFMDLERQIVYDDPTPMRVALYAVQGGKRLTGQKLSWLAFIANDPVAYCYYVGELAPNADDNDTQGIYYKYLKDTEPLEQYKTAAAGEAHYNMMQRIAARIQQQREG